MAILRKSALALAAMFCLAVAVPVFAQDKATSDVKAAQSTVKDMQALGASIKSRQASAMSETGSTPVAAPVVRTTTDAGKKATGKKVTGKKAGGKKKKNP
jgi:hypothetical protein